MVCFRDSGVHFTNVEGLAYSADFGFLNKYYVTNPWKKVAKAIRKVKIQFLAQTLCLMTNIDCGGKRCVIGLQP